MTRISIALLTLAFCAVLGLAQQCLPKEERIDCHPNPYPANGDEVCRNRGCELCVIEPVDWNIPICYLPKNYGYLIVGQPENTGHGYRVTLQRATNITLFGGDSELLTLDIDFQSDYRLRIEFTDGTPRFEVPIRIDPPAGGNSNLLYEVEFVNDPVFSFKVIRKSSGSILFDTSLGGLTFSDQFLQISTRLPSTNLYGLGENEQSTSKHQFEKFPVWPLFAKDQSPSGNANMYGTQPHYTVVENDGSAHAVAWVNSNAQEFVVLPAPGLLYRTIGGIIDLYIFLGPTPENTVEQYTEAVGRTTVPPYWSLGFQLCRYGYNTLEDIQAAVNRTRQYQIPHDVQYGDIDIMDGGRDFTISADRFGGLPEYVKELKAQGIKFMTILDPGIAVEPGYRPYDWGNELDIWIKKPNGEPAVGRVWPAAPVVFPDFAKNETREWWITLMKDFHEILDWDAMWIDMNEPVSFVDGDLNDGCANNKYNYPPYLPKMPYNYLPKSTLCMDNQDSLGIHYNTHSLYGWLESEPTMAGVLAARPGKRPYALSRSTYLGTGRWVSHWLGDNHSEWWDMKASIIGMLQFNQWGIPFVGPDTCGHFGNSEADLCQRWSELGAFYPYSRNHNGNENRDQDPGFFGPDVANSARKALEVRYTLLPYLYTLFYNHETKGGTVARALFHEYPTDSIALNVDEQFLLGPGLMVTPVLAQGATSVQGYFPDSRWFDYYEGREMNARNSTVTLSAPLDFINIHLRGGIIYPTQEPAINTEASRLNPLGLIVALDDSNRADGRMFYDDGESLDTIQSGEYYLVHHIYENGELISDVENNGYPRMSSLVLDSIRLLGAKQNISRVRVDGKIMPTTRLSSGEIIVKGLGLDPTLNHRITFE